MSGFNSKCLINISKCIEDVDAFRTLIKSDRKQAVKELADQCVRFVLPEPDEISDGLDGYYAQSGCYGDSDEVIIGLENPNGLISFAESMKGIAKETAKSLVKSAGVQGSSSVSETIDAVEMDSLESFLIRHAFEIFDNCVNTDCHAMYYNGNSFWTVWPVEAYDLQEIKNNPEKWVVIELLFK
ncbi:MAG: hypothetical protein RR415_06170 [Ruthenibacterium sp.]